MSNANLPQARMSSWEDFWYIVGCILTLGWVYFRKITLKRAMVEALAGTVQTVIVYAPPTPYLPAPSPLPRLPDDVA